MKASKLYCVLDAYVAINDVKHACIGSWGKDCANSCNYGFFGHGCRQECNCSEQLQICDSKIGCTDLDRTGKIRVLAIFIPVTCVIAFFLFGTVIHFYFFKEKRGKSGTFRRDVTTHASANNLQDETHCANYNDIRESYFMDRDCDPVTSTCRMSKYFSKDCQQMNMDDNPSKQATFTPSLSKHVSPTEYKSCFEELDGYSRLELRSLGRSLDIRNMNR